MKYLFTLSFQKGLDADYTFIPDTQICAHSVPGPVVLFPGEEYRTLMPASLLLLLKRVPSAPVDEQNRGHHFIA